VGNFFVTLATADAPIVTLVVDSALVSVLAEIKPCLMDTTVAAAVRVVVVLVNLESFKTGLVF